MVKKKCSRRVGIIILLLLLAHVTMYPNNIILASIKRETVKSVSTYGTYPIKPSSPSTTYDPNNYAPSDPEHYWAFDGDLSDSGTGDPVVLTPVNGTGYNSTAPFFRRGSAIEFNGTRYLYNDTFLDDWRTKYNSTGWGISLWFYVDTTQNYKPILHKYTVWEGSDPDDGICIYPNRVDLYVDSLYIRIPISYDTGAWNHIVVTQAPNGTVWIYYNEHLINKTVGFTTVPSDAGTGKTNFTIGENFDGLVDEVRFYSRYLTYEDVKKLCQAPPPPPAGDWYIDVNTEIQNEEIVVNGNIVIGLENSLTGSYIAREVNITFVNVKIYFNATENVSLYTPGGRMDFVNMTNVEFYNLTSNYYSLKFVDTRIGGLFLKNIYVQHAGYDTNYEAIRLVRTDNVFFKNITIYDTNATALILINVDNSIFEDITMLEFYDGIYVDGQSSGNTFKNVYAYSHRAYGYVGTYGTDDTWINYTAIAYTHLKPHMPFEWKGNNTTIINSSIYHADNGIYVATDDPSKIIRVYNLYLYNCADGFDSGCGTIYAYNVIFNMTRDRVISMEGSGFTAILNRCKIINTNPPPAGNTLYYVRGNVTFINTIWEPTIEYPVGDYPRNITQIWEFDDGMKVKIVTIDDDSNFKVVFKEVVRGDKYLRIVLGAPSDVNSTTTIYTAEYGKPLLIKRSDTGTKLREVPSLSDLDKFTNCWYYDSMNNLVYIKLRHFSTVTIEVDWRKERRLISPIVTPKRIEEVEEKPKLRPMTIIDYIRTKLGELWKSILEYFRRFRPLPTLTQEHLVIGLLLVGIIAILLRKYRVLLLIVGVLVLILITRFFT
ncbi:MAG: hypothetical protein DRP01_09410 [Archaeoglobales archaeon]|nr:MAG: hypothetical protein DRP01_09410 [Archaeoglobales archaeon]